MKITSVSPGVLLLTVMLLPSAFAKRNPRDVAVTEVNENTVKFYLYTKRSTTPQQLKIGDVKALDKINARLPIRIVIHGLLSKWDAPDKMTQNIKNTFMKHLDVNVIAVDWGYHSDTWWYPSASAAVPAVGAYVGEFVEFLVSHKVRPSEVHMIGHSLGAHVSGFAGKRLKNSHITISRITGLDPSSPGFERYEGPSNRLASGDATFVDVIHTNGETAGIDYKAGDADFYPNGGESQPGCNRTSTFQRMKCSHSRSWHYFEESIAENWNNRFCSRKCYKIEKGKPTSCEKYVRPTQKMGYYASPNLRGYFYLTTNPTPPYSRSCW